MWKLKDFAEGCNKRENALKLKAALESLKVKINKIIEIEVGINYTDSTFACDVVLYSIFNSKEDLDIYKVHPEHLKVVEFVQKIIESRSVVDYEIKI